MPVLSGGVVTAGTLRIRPLVPANPTLSVVSWTTVDPGEFLSGYKLEIRGGTGAYVVRLELVDQMIGLFVDGFEGGNTAAWGP